MAESADQRIQRLEAELSAAKAEVDRLRAELEKARAIAADAASRISTVENEANKRALEERSRRR